MALFGEHVQKQTKTVVDGYEILLFIACGHSRQYRPPDEFGIFMLRSLSSKEAGKRKAYGVSQTNNLSLSVMCEKGMSPYE